MSVAGLTKADWTVYS